MCPRGLHLWCFYTYLVTMCSILCKAISLITISCEKEQKTIDALGLMYKNFWKCLLHRPGFIHQIAGALAAY